MRFRHLTLSFHLSPLSEKEELQLFEQKFLGQCFGDGGDGDGDGDGGDGGDGDGDGGSDADQDDSDSPGGSGADASGPGGGDGSFGDDFDDPSNSGLGGPGLDAPGEGRGFFDSLLDGLLNTITDPVGIASIALGAPGWAAYAFSKGLGALGVDVRSIANMVGLTPDSRGLTDLAEAAAQKAAADLGITEALSGISTNLGFDTAIDSVQKGIASLGVGDPAQPGIGATGYAGNPGEYAGNLGGTGYADGPGIAGLSFAPGTGPAMADTTNPNGVTPSWSPVDFQQYSGMADTTNLNGVAPSFMSFSGSPVDFQQYSGIGGLRNV